MRIYTSYYARFRPNESRIGIKVSVSAPKGFEGLCGDFKELYPKWEWVNAYKEGTLSLEEYERLYMEQLRHLDQYDVRKKIEEVSGGKDAVLLCWEGKGPCHRHWLAKWLSVGLPYVVTEL